MSRSWLILNMLSVWSAWAVGPTGVVDNAMKRYRLLMRAFYCFSAAWFMHSMGCVYDCSLTVRLGWIMTLGLLYALLEIWAFGLE